MGRWISQYTKVRISEISFTMKFKIFRSEEEMQAIRTEEDFLAKMEKKRQKAALKAVQHLNFV